MTCYSYYLNNPLKYTDPSGYQYRPEIMYLPPWAQRFLGGGGGFGNGTTHDGFMHNIHAGNGTYYDWNSGLYYNNDGFIISHTTAFNNIYNSYHLSNSNSKTVSDVLFFSYTLDGQKVNDFIGLHFTDASQWYANEGSLCSFLGLMDNSGFLQNYDDQTVGDNSSTTLWNYVNKGIEAAGIYYSVKGNAFHNELYWKGKTTGKFYTTGKYGTTNYLKMRGGYANSFKVVGKPLQVAKSLGTKLGYLGLGLTAYDMIWGEGMTTSNVLNATFGVAGFIPGVGWAISGSYFLINTGVQLYSGKSIGEHWDE